MIANHHLAKVLVEDRRRELVASAEAARARRAARNGRVTAVGRLFHRGNDRISPAAPVPAAAPVPLRLPLAGRPETAPAGRTPAGAEGRAA